LLEFNVAGPGIAVASGPANARMCPLGTFQADASVDVSDRSRLCRLA